MYHNSGVITLSTGEANRLIHPDWTFSSLPSLCFILSCPKRAFTSIYFRCVLPKQTAFISLKGHNISSCITLADIFVLSPDTTALSLSVSLVSDLKMAAIRQRYLELFNVRPQQQAGVLWKIQPFVQQEHTRFYALGVRDAGSCKSMIPLFSEDSGLWRVACFQAEVWGWKWHTNGSSHMPRVWALHKQVTRARVRIASQTPENRQK